MKPFVDQPRTSNTKSKGHQSFGFDGPPPEGLRALPLTLKQGSHRIAGAAVDNADTPVALQTPTQKAAELVRLMAMTNEAIVYFDKDLVARYCNDVYLNAHGLSEPEVIGRSIADYQPDYQRSHFAEILLSCHYGRVSSTAINYSAVFKRWVMVRVFPIDDGTLLIASDASNTLVTQHEIAQQALIDPLTGVKNKVGLLQDMNSLLHNQLDFTLGLLGLNRFKEINHTQGFAKGDVALLEISKRLRSHMMADEMIYRVSGDEFAFLILGSSDRALERLHHLAVQTALPITMGEQTFVLGSCGGAVHSPSFGSDAEALLRRASIAFRQAKGNRRSSIVPYVEEFESVVSARLNLEASLRRCMDLGGFDLMLQPKGDVASGRVVGGEALIRWPHPIKGQLLPAEFLPLAQDCGMMPMVDRWVIRRALDYLSKMKAAGCLVPISINLSMESLSDRHLVEDLKYEIEISEVDPSFLEIEIPEGALMHDVETSSAVLKGLADLGVEISIDDFGTGFSSFAYLTLFPVNTLKVDRSFINKMQDNPNSRAIVRGLVKMAHSMTMRVVAEGAENDDQILILRQIRCDEVQGYAYARPMVFDDFCSFVHNHKGDPVVLSA